MYENMHATTNKVVENNNNIYGCRFACYENTDILCAIGLLHSGQ
jgi:hypothetical protein